MVKRDRDQKYYGGNMMLGKCMAKMMNRWRLGTLLAIALLQACAGAPQQTLYEKIGGEPVVQKIVDNFIVEIGYDQQIFKFFAESDIDRFREKMTEHICHVTDGPCQYTGDTMLDVHANMGVKEGDFNRTVDLLINAMTQADVPHPLQNQLVARLAPMRGDIIYR